MFSIRSMMARSICGALVAAALLVTANAGAAESISLTLDDALERAKDRAPEVVIGAHAVREARARRAGAGVVFPTNPRLSMDARPPITGGNLSDVGYGATLELLTELGGAPAARVREVERAAELAEVELGAERVRARAAAWTAYLRANVAGARVDQTRELISAARRILDASKQRAGAGASGDIEESIAAGDLAQLEVVLEGASREREAQLSALRDVLDLPATQPLALTTALGDPPAPPETSDLVARALRARPELAQIRARVALLDATGERLEKETFPRIGGYVGIDAAPLSPIFGVVGVTVELPFAQRNQGPRAVVEAARAGDVERLALQARRIEREVTTARAAYEARRAELDLLTRSAVPSAERALELVEVGWRAGRFDVFRVASAARDVARARGLRLDALEAAWLERIALDRATGGASGGTR
jgi:cobalt-zinc-cadmium efflux system outer membrane protein